MYLTQNEMGILYELKAFPKLVVVQQRLARVKLPQKIIGNKEEFGRKTMIV